MAVRWMLAAACLAAAAPVVAQQDAVDVPIRLAPTLGNAPMAGRLIVFAQRVAPGAKPAEEVDTSPFRPTDTAIAARETWSLAPGAIAHVDGEADAFPTAFSRLPPGTYRFQAVLDRNHDYNYRGRGEGDVTSRVVEARLPGPAPLLTLDTVVPPFDMEAALAKRPAAEREALRAGMAAVQPVDFVSPSLSAFWGRAVHVRGWVALPPGYQASGGTTWPTAFSTGGFGSTLTSARANAASMIARMKDGTAPPMIWVYLDESSATGTHEFADSVNNGPWGQALTAEFIPWLERRYAMDARAGSRFLTGHSSGGWATLWLQVRYPKVFGGTWPTAPDPSDFHDFTNIDLYAANANAYHDGTGRPLPLVRDKGKVVATVEQFAKLERVLGPYGGQLASFEWVFSPKGADGRPQPMFDRATGTVDPAVAAYWRDHYDIAHIVARDWPVLKPDLDGKIHLYVGTADTFYLDGPARRLDAVFRRLRAHQDFTYVRGRTHFDLFVRGKDRMALLNDIAWQMYAKARPGSRLRSKRAR